MNLFIAFFLHLPYFFFNRKIYLFKPENINKIWNYIFVWTYVVFAP